MNSYELSRARDRGHRGSVRSPAPVAATGGGGAAETPPAPPAVNQAEIIRDVFLLLDRGPLHLRLKITIGGKSPQAVRRDYLTRLFKQLDTDGDGKLSRLEFDRSPLNTSRRGPNSRPLSPKEAAEIVPESKLVGCTRARRRGDAGLPPGQRRTHDR